jgi:hypothetical protein
MSNSWWVIEYDNRDFDSGLFLEFVNREFELLRARAGRDSEGARILHKSAMFPKRKLWIYVSPKAASLPGANHVLRRYRAKRCLEPTGEDITELKLLS